MTRRALLVVVVAALALTGCRSGADTKTHVTTQTVFLERLSRAITDVNTARRRLADDGAAIGTAARRLDDVDAVAVTGDKAAVRAARPAAARATTPANSAARTLKKDVTTYDRAVAALATAIGEGLDATQHAALTGVVTAERAEVAELRTYVTVIATIWPRYEALDANQVLWLMRASNGWYRDRQESANAYVVLTDRAALDAARRSLAAADTRRLAAARKATAAIDTARGALASLLG